MGAKRKKGGRGGWRQGKRRRNGRERRSETERNEDRSRERERRMEGEIDRREREK